MLGAAGLAPLLAAVGAGTLAQDTLAQWLVSMGGNMLAGWVGDLALWAAGKPLASADPAEAAQAQQELAAKLDELLARDTASAAAFTRLLSAIDAAPQSLAALHEEIGAQSDLLLAQYALLKQIHAGTERLGVEGAALGPVVVAEADRVIAALEARVDRSDAKLDQALRELRALRDIQRHSIQTSGGDYAEGNIDKRQGSFIEGQAQVYGPVVGQHTGSIQTTYRHKTEQHYHLSPAGAPTGSAFQTPYPPNPVFMGRAAEMDALAAILSYTQTQTVALLPAITGLGGIGKTQLAAEFTHQYRERFPGGVFWLNMAQPETVAGQVAACAGPGGLDLPGWQALDFDARIAAAQHAWREPTMRLLVMDNLEDPKLLTWRPTSGRTRVLLTTRRGVWSITSGVVRIPLSVLDRTNSMQLLLEPRARWLDLSVVNLLANPNTAQASDAICDAVGDLPLALALAGAYLESHPNVSVPHYQTRLDEYALAHPSLDADLEEALPTAHTTSVVATIALSYDQLDPAQ